MKKSQRGGVGLIVLLLSLLIVGILAYKNIQTQKNLISPGTSANALAPEQLINKFQGDQKAIEEIMKKREEVPQIPGQ